MQTLFAARNTIKCLKSQRLLSAVASSSSSSVPWFVDEQPMRQRGGPHSPQPQLQAQDKPLPEDIPPILSTLHAELSRSPFLERGGVEVCRPLLTEPGPALPSAIPRGRRQRGRTEFGVGIPDDGGSLWRWILLAQVKEGSEARGAIESVMRIVRKTLLTSQYAVTLPPNKKRRVQDGWGMLDAGDFAVHILSRTARKTYFTVEQSTRTWQY